MSPFGGLTATCARGLECFPIIPSTARVVRRSSTDVKIDLMILRSEKDFKHYKRNTQLNTKVTSMSDINQTDDDRYIAHMPSSSSIAIKVVVERCQAS